MLNSSPGGGLFVTTKIYPICYIFLIKKIHFFTPHFFSNCFDDFWFFLPPLFFYPLFFLNFFDDFWFFSPNFFLPPLFFFNFFFSKSEKNLGVPPFFFEICILFTKIWKKSGGTPKYFSKSDIFLTKIWKKSGGTPKYFSKSQNFWQKSEKNYGSGIMDQIFFPKSSKRSFFMIWIMKNHDPDQKNALFFMIRIQKKVPLFFDPDLFFYLAQKMYFCIRIHDAKK